MKRISIILSLITAILVMFSSCKKEDQTQDQTPLVEDGYYIVGTSVKYQEMRLAGMMEPGYVEGEGFAAIPREGMYQKYIYITASGDGFIVKQQAGANQYNWGLDGQWTQVRGDTVLVGSIKQDGANFTAPKDGFYLFVIDMNLMKAYLLRVEAWSVIGDATPGGWSDDSQQELATVSITDSTGEWQIDNIVLIPKSIKFRFNHWWTYYDADPNAADNGDPKFFTNLGGSLTELTPGGANIPVDQTAIYTVKLYYVLGKGFTAELIQTGTPDVYDYSKDTISLIGSNVGVYRNGQEYFAASWSEDLDLKYVGASGTTYIFEIDSVILPANTEFKFRKNHDWGVNWGYNDVTVAGDAADITVSSNYGNFLSTTSKVYKIQFAIDGLSHEATVTFTYIMDYTTAPDDPSQHVFSLIGSALYYNNDTTQSASNWDYDLDFKYSGQDANGNYVFVIDTVYFITGGEFKIRRDHDWGFNYGYDDVTITGATANFADADPNAGNSNFKVVTGGSYKVTMSMDANYGNVVVDFQQLK